MMINLTDETIKYIISRVLDNANDAFKEFEKAPNDAFYSGKRLAYYEILDTIKNELIVRGQDLKEFGLDADLDNEIA